MKDPLNVLYYMRNRRMLSQKELANETELTANDISRLENGNLGAGIEKPIALAKYFSISLEALVFNKLEDVLANLTEGPEINHKLLGRINMLQKSRDNLGRDGETWVFQQEVKKLKGTKFANGVIPFWNDEDAHFDILSFDCDGTPIIIEVKSTNGRASKNFFMTIGELMKARECAANGTRYEVHRVHHFGNSKKRGRVIISGEELLSNYNFKVDSYVVSRKKAS